MNFLVRLNHMSYWSVDKEWKEPSPSQAMVAILEKLLKNHPIFCQKHYFSPTFIYHCHFFEESLGSWSQSQRAIDEDGVNIETNDNSH